MNWTFFAFHILNAPYSDWTIRSPCLSLLLPNALIWCVSLLSSFLLLTWCRESRRRYEFCSIPKEVVNPDPLMNLVLLRGCPESGRPFFIPKGFCAGINTNFLIVTCYLLPRVILDFRFLSTQRHRVLCSLRLCVFACNLFISYYSYRDLRSVPKGLFEW